MRTGTLLFFCLALGLLAVGTAPAQVVTGQIASKTSGPRSGVTLVLIDAEKDRSAPVFSAADGSFAFNNVVPRPAPYYIEAYWGKELIYRRSFTYNGSNPQLDIKLP